jgi:hypothetical protein
MARAGALLAALILSQGQPANSDDDPGKAAAAGPPPSPPPPASWMLWPRDVGDFVVPGPSASARLTWNVSTPAAWGTDAADAAKTFSYRVGTYTGCSPKCLRGGPNHTCLLWNSCPRVPNATGTAVWSGERGSPLSLSLSLPTSGFYTVTWRLPSGFNASFGVVVLPTFPAHAPRDPVFSVCTFLSLADYGPSWTPQNGGFAQPDSPPWNKPHAPHLAPFANYRPEFSKWRSQIIPILSRLGVASVREWGVGTCGSEFFQNGSMTFRQDAVKVKEELAAANLGIVDLQLGAESWMGLDWGGRQYPRNLSA